MRAACQVLRTIGERPDPRAADLQRGGGIPLAEIRETVTVYPSLLLAMLKQNQEAAGRVYLLLRYLDKAGRGWLPVS